MKDEIFRAEIYSLLDDMDKALSAALSAPLLAKQKPLEQLAKLQRRFNQKMAKAVCYG